MYSLSYYLAAADPSLWEHIASFFEQGGFFMGMLAATSVVGIAAVIFKWLSLMRGRIIPESIESKIERLDDNGDREAWQQLQKESEHDKSVLGRLAWVIFKLRGRPRAEVTEAVQSVARSEIVRMQAGMMVIDVVISVAPLLGLLGTASGLVVVFSGLEGSDADWKEIAKGIGRALKTTIVGIAIAVPAIIAQGYFQRRIETYAARMEVLMTRLTQVFDQEPVKIDKHQKSVSMASDDPV